MNINYLNKLRIEEIKIILAKHRDIFDGKRILEIGGGTGVQATEIKKIAAEVISLEIQETNYLDHMPSHVTFYDGYHIPFLDNHFDAVYSSNVLEHVSHRDEFQKEIMRVLKPRGYAIHVMPTHWWRLREMLQNLVLFIPRCLKYLLLCVSGKSIPKLPFWAHIFGDKHGEFGGVITELYYFMPSTWKMHFRRIGWEIDKIYPIGLFYTGRLVLGPRVPLAFRKLMGKFLGSSCYVYLMKNIK